MNRVSRLPFSGSAIRTAAVLALVLVAIGEPLAGQGDRWEQQVARALERASESLGGRGYRAVGSPAGGMLFVDESARFEVSVSSAAEYLLVGVCDDDCRGLSLVISNPTGYEVDAARGPGNAPMVRVGSPVLAGTYRVTVTMTGCRVSPCRYGVGTYVRRVERASR
jgi:hypothetical protein